MTDAITSHTLAELKQAVRDCSERGLMAASKWASDILLSVSQEKKRQLRERSRSALAAPSGAGFSTSTPARPVADFDAFLSSSEMEPPKRAAVAEEFPEPKMVGKHLFAPRPQRLTPEEAYLERSLQEDEQDLLAGAKAFFDSREFRRITYMLSECKSAKSLFMSTYAYFLATERQALVDWHKLDCNRNQPSVPVNTGLKALADRLEGVKDPWCLFLKALFLSRLAQREEAIEAVMISIATYPWNWSAWNLLGSCVNDLEELNALLPLIPLPSTHPLVQFFLMKTSCDLQNPGETDLVMCDRLLTQEFFPDSLWLMSTRAGILYHLREYAEAENQFDRIMARDPYRVDDIDMFSNILYVQGNKLKLSTLAQDFIALDKDRPEVCCLVGNHYSLRQEHEKAVRYFRRATNLDRTYLTAWTLMGHEYVEMKNSQAAIEAYRRAVDINRKDYRAWYGLGQAYELLSMHHYALYYYQHATALRPYDVRLWQAQGSCYEEIGRPREAIECYKRALISSEAHEVTLCLKLARLYKLLEEHAEAAGYHSRIVRVCQQNNRPVTEYSKSSLEVAEFQMTVGDFLMARALLEQVSKSNAEEAPRATEMLKTCIAKLAEGQMR